MTKRHHRRGGRTTPKGTRPPARSSHATRGRPPLVADAEACLTEPSPFALMAMASGLIEATTPRPLDGWRGEHEARPDGPTTFLSLADSGWPAMGALALAIAAMHPDETFTARVRRAVDPDVTRRGPAWLASMGSIHVTATSLQTDPLGDGENVLVSWQWLDGSACTAIVYVDHNMGTLVKDAFVVPEDGHALSATYASLGDRHVSVRPIDPAEARARVVEAIEHGERTVPPFETESWPACRPMVEWVLRRLPAGGAGYVRPDWPEEARQRLLDEFMASPFAEVDGLRPDQVRSLADPLLWFGCDYGPGDPLRWSPVSVEILLTDWYARKVFGIPDSEVRRLPDVLDGFVRFAHRRTHVPADLSAETLDAVGRWRDDFLRAVRRPGRSREANAAWLARVAAGLDPDDFDDLDDSTDDLDQEHDDLDDAEYVEHAARKLERMVIELVGGRARYDLLDDAPLSDRPFDWSVVPEPVRGPTTETLRHLDEWGSELFDDEVRTISRAVLAGVVAADPGVFKRSARTDALAAAILSFLLTRLTGRFSASERRQMPWTVFTQKELAEATGVPASSISGRTRTVANVVERADIDWPSNLHSTQRREALRTRQIVADWRDRHA